ncbi:MAG: CS1-pili formation C-terminal domain-containing protein, partial [Endozoicomonas sp.]
SLSIAGSASSEEALTELSWLKLGKSYQLGVSAMLADRGRFGYSSHLFKQWHRLSTQLSYRRLSSTSIHFKSSDGASNRPQLLNNGFQQGSASFSLPLFNGSLELRRSFYQQQHPQEGQEGEAGTTRTDTISWSGMLWTLGDFALRFRTEISQNRDRDKGAPNKSLSIMGNIELNQRHYYGYNKLSHQTRTLNREQPNLTTREQKRQYHLATTWYDRELLQDDLVIDAFAEESEKSSTVSAGIRFNGQYLDTSIGLNHVRTDDAPSVSSYSGRLSASLITDGESVFIGGRGSTESGLRVKLNGKMRGSFDIWINGQRQGYSSIGNSSLISLTPFNTYKVFIRPQGEGHFEYDEAEHEFTLYPGNIQTLSWDIEQVLVLIGQLQDPEGNPLSNALLEGVIGTSDTDSHGLFQARVLEGKRSFEAVLPDGSTCRVALPESLEVRRGVVLTGSLSCIIP